MRKPHARAKVLRKDMPTAERKLWAFIRRKALGGFRFRRQHTIGPFIADFACVEIKVVIELDGDQHGKDHGARDAKRDAYIEDKGWTVLRFWNNEVYENINGVLETILNTCENSKRAIEVEKSKE